MRSGPLEAGAETGVQTHGVHRGQAFRRKRRGEGWDRAEACKVRTRPRLSLTPPCQEFSLWFPVWAHHWLKVPRGGSGSRYPSWQAGEGESLVKRGTVSYQQQNSAAGPRCRGPGEGVRWGISSVLRVLSGAIGEGDPLTRLARN